VADPAERTRLGAAARGAVALDAAAFEAFLMERLLRLLPASGT